MVKKKNEPLYALVNDEDMDDLSEDIDDIAEDTDEILRRIDRNLQNQQSTEKKVNYVILLWVLDKAVMIFLIWLGLNLF